MGATGGFGVTFQIGSGPLSGTPTYSSIGQVKTWKGIEIEAVMSDFTHHGSAGGYQEFVPSGRKNISPIELGIAYDKSIASHTDASGGLYHALDNGSKLAYKITLPDATTWEFDAYVIKLTQASEQEEHIDLTVELQPTGQPTHVDT